jgi:S-adenosylmethionine synthetase
LAKFIYEKFSYDGKTQITINDNQKITAVVVSFQNVKKAELKKMVNTWLENEDVEEEIDIHLNPAGDWSVGGFEADTGVTGRKLAVDNYGPNIPIGGGCFSGKDATKVDRSGAYLARKVAVEILQADDTMGNVLVQVSYAIGKKYPIEVVADIVYNDGRRKRLDKTMEYRERFVPANIIRELKLQEPQFEKTAEWGHFGNGFSWDEGIVVEN